MPMRAYRVTLRQEAEWEGIIDALDADEALMAAHREARFEAIIAQDVKVKEICMDEEGSEIEVDVTPDYFAAMSIINGPIQ